MASIYAGVPIVGAGTPSGPPRQTDRLLYVDKTAGDLYIWKPGTETWAKVTDDA